MTVRQIMRARWLTVVACGLVLATAGCSSAAGSAPQAEPTATAVNGPMLERGNWSQSTYNSLVELVSAERNKGKFAIFDFDNTTQARDVGEAATAQTQADESLDPTSIPASVVPPLVIGGKETTIQDGVLEYYERWLASGHHKMTRLARTPRIQSWHSSGLGSQFRTL